LRSTPRGMASNASSRLIVDAFEVRSVEETKIQGKLMDMKVGDPGARSSPSAD